MSVKIESIEKIPEMINLHRTLDELRKEALKLVADSKNSEHALKRATAIAEKLKSALTFETNVSKLTGRRRCPPGTTYDPIINGCV